MTAAPALPQCVPESPAWIRWSNALLIGALALVAVLSVAFAYTTHFAGSPDSQNNMETARNLARGKGFISSIVQQLVIPQTLPNPEVIRPPGVPYLLAGCFRVFGVSLKVAVLLNGLLVILTALVLCATTRALVGAVFGNLAGVLWLLSGNYQVISIWNSGFLVLATTCLLCLYVAQQSGHLSLRATAIAYGLVGGAGYLFKPTFALSVVPFAVAALWFNGPVLPAGRKLKLVAVALFFTIFAATTSPYWVRDFILFGKPLSSPVPLLRLADRYGGLPSDTWWTLRFGKPVTYREMINIHGLTGLLKTEQSMLTETLLHLAQLGPAILLLVALGIGIHAGRQNWHKYLVPSLLVIEPLFPSFYMHSESRYLWPVFPVMIVMLAVAVRDYRSWGYNEVSRGWARRIRIISGGLLAVSLLWGTLQAAINWRGAFIHGHRSPPSWISAVRQTPSDATVLTDDPWGVAWHGERKAAICPGGERADLVQVIRIYRPTYFLETGYLKASPRAERKNVAFSDHDLELVATGEHEKTPWSLFKINPEKFPSDAP